MSRSSSSLINASTVRALCSRISSRPAPIRGVVKREERAGAVRFSLQTRAPEPTSPPEPETVQVPVESEGAVPRLVPTPVDPVEAVGLSESTLAEVSPARLSSARREPAAPETYEHLEVIIEDLARALVDTTHYTPQERLLELLEQVRETLDARDVFLCDQVGLPITASSSNEESIVFAAALLAELNRWRPMNVFEGALTVVECSPSEFLNLLFVRGQVETFIVGVVTRGALASGIMDTLSVALGAVQSH